MLVGTPAELPQDADSDADFEDIEFGEQEMQEEEEQVKKNKPVHRQAWQDEEVEELERLFPQCFAAKCVPDEAHYDKVMESTQALNLKEGPINRCDQKFGI